MIHFFCHHELPEFLEEDNQYVLEDLALLYGLAIKYQAKHLRNRVCVKFTQNVMSIREIVYEDLVPLVYNSVPEGERSLKEPLVERFGDDFTKKHLTSDEMDGNLAKHGDFLADAAFKSILDGA